MRYEHGYFDLDYAKGVLGSFSPRLSNLGHNWKTAHHRAKGTNIWALGAYGV